MKIGISFLGVQARRHVPLAVKAEQLGFESCWQPEHLVMPASMPQTSPSDSHHALPATVINPATQLYDPWVALSFIAARTQSIQLGTDVYILPLRHPIITARAVATLDMLSNGRIHLGCGIGWLQGEFEAVGQGWQDRAGRTNEIVEVLRKLWTQEVIEHRGKHYSFGPVKFEPKPTRKPHPPIHIGGASPGALRRAGQIGDGWIGMRHSPQELQGIVRVLQQHRREAGREHLPFEVTARTSGYPSQDDLLRLQEAGADRVLVVPWVPPEGRMTLDRALAGLEEFAGKVLARLR